MNVPDILPLRPVIVILLIRDVLRDLVGDGDVMVDVGHHEVVLIDRGFFAFDLD